jgi:hypothetical protein
MSQLDLARTLREARPVAPPDLRERVRLVAAHAAPPRRQLVTWRTALVAAALVVVAVVAGVLATRPDQHQAQRQQSLSVEKDGAYSTTVGAAHAAAQDRTALAPLTVPASSKRIQRYSASLELRLRDAVAVSDASKRAIAIAHNLGGYEQRINVDTARTTGYASILLRIPKRHVQEAVRRLTALGTIVSEDVQVQDLQGRVDATDRLLTRLQQRLADLRAHVQDTQTVEQITALAARIERLQRGRAATVRSARYATVNLQLTTRTLPAPVHHGHGPLHGLGVAFRWIGIGAVYALALGLPAALLVLLFWSGARTLRRRREDALLSRS